MNEKAGVRTTPSTKVDLNHSKVARLEGLDDVAKALFPGNKKHQCAFLAIFVEVKWAPGQFLPVLEPIADKYGIRARTFETVRAKMRRLGIIDHVCRFNKAYGYREGWVLSGRFSASLARLGETYEMLRICRDSTQEKKERDLYRYL
ncbi:MAG: hypothetical protein NTU83_09645 [Candidatus Hydrogenedentes bacterium]|nr:hypothetical protein [Candidatus Hydrogenedentota bacterium]